MGTVIIKNPYTGKTQQAGKKTKVSKPSAEPVFKKKEFGFYESIGTINKKKPGGRGGSSSKGGTATVNEPQVKSSKAAIQGPQQQLEQQQAKEQAISKVSKPTITSRVKDEATGLTRTTAVQTQSQVIRSGKLRSLPTSAFSRPEPTIKNNLQQVELAGEGLLQEKIAEEKSQRLGLIQKERDIIPKRQAKFIQEKKVDISNKIKSLNQKLSITTKRIIPEYKEKENNTFLDSPIFGAKVKSKSRKIGDFISGAKGGVISSFRDQPLNLAIDFSAGLAFGGVAQKVGRGVGLLGSSFRSTALVAGTAFVGVTAGEVALAPTPKAKGKVTGKRVVQAAIFTFGAKTGSKAFIEAKKFSPRYDPLLSEKVVPSTQRGTQQQQKSFEGKKVELFTATDTPFKEFFKPRTLSEVVSPGKITVKTPRSGLGKERLSFKKKFGKTEKGLFSSPNVISEGFARNPETFNVFKTTQKIPKVNIASGTKGRLQLLYSEKPGVIRPGRLRAGVGNEVEFIFPEKTKLRVKGETLGTYLSRKLGKGKGQTFGFSRNTERFFEVLEIEPVGKLKTARKSKLKKQDTYIKRQKTRFKQNFKEFKQPNIETTINRSIGGRRLKTRRTPPPVVRFVNPRMAGRKLKIPRTSPPRTPLPRTSPPRTPLPRTLPFKFKLPKGEKRGKKGKSILERELRYTPSLVAGVQKIKGTKPGILSGLEVRPI